MILFAYKNGFKLRGLKKKGFKLDQNENNTKPKWAKV